MWGWGGGEGDKNKSCAHAHMYINKHMLNTSNETFESFFFLPVSWNSVSNAGNVTIKLSAVVKTLHPVVNARILKLGIRVEFCIFHSRRIVADCLFGKCDSRRSNINEAKNSSD